MKKNLIASILVLAAAAGGAGWWASHRSADANVATAAAGNGRGGPQSVSVAVAQQRDVPVTIEAAGTVVALNSVEIRPQVSSTVRQVAIQEGQFVRKGDLLFSFDDRTDRANLDKARAQLQRDRVTLADLERQWQRAQDLRAQNFIAQSSADSVLAQLDAQRAAVQADEAAVQASDVALSFGALRAPLAGRIGTIAVNPGSLVQPSGAALATINQIDPIGVSFSVPEAQLGAVLHGVVGPAGSSAGNHARPGAKSGGKDAAGDTPLAALNVLLPSERGRSQPATLLPGRLIFVDNTVDTTTGTIRVKGAVPNAQQQLWPGQYVTVRLALRTLKDAIVIPQAALIQRGTERSVYVVGADGTAQARPVQMRYAFGELAVVEGLQVGDKVVVDGKQNLRAGTPVREMAASAGKGASGAASGASAAASGAAR
ncbi:MAG: efflux RND transporter periplasmic adaptor subunit [Leptothrix sp. (in: b-proteobacteria)]